MTAGFAQGHDPDHAAQARSQSPARPHSARSASAPPRDAVLQRAVGNQGLQRADASSPATRVAPQHDADEQRADAFADRFARARPTELRHDGTPPSASAAARPAGPGQPLDAAIRTRFERALGAELGDVELHADGAAADSAAGLRAAAFSVGSHVVFGRDNYDPQSPRGERLLAHELAHVVQHRRQHPESVAHRAPEDAADLDRRIAKAIQEQKWQEAAEQLAKFQDAAMNERLGRIPLSQLRSLQLGALQHPRLGKDSTVAKNIERAIHAAMQNITSKAAQGSPDLTLPTSDAGTGAAGQPGYITVGGGGDPRVPAAQQEQLAPTEDWSADPKYIDKGIVGAWYDILTGYFEIDYQDGTFLSTLDYGQVLAGAAGGPAMKTYFRNKVDGRVYPSRFGRNTVPTLVACATKLHEKEPEARERLKDALINVAVSAQGVAGATLRAGQAQAGAGGPRGRPKQKADQPPAKKPAANESPSGGTGSRPAGGGEPAKPGAMSAAPQQGGAAGKSTGGLQQVTPGARTFVPAEGLPPADVLRKLPPGGLSSTPGAYAWRAAGEIMLELERLGPGILVSAEQGAAVAGGSVVAQGTLKVGAFQIFGAALISGGKLLLGAAPGAVRAVRYILVFRDSVALVVQSAPGSDQPAKAPGTDSTPAKTPGGDSMPAQAPAKDAGSAKAPGRSTGSATAPGAVRYKEQLLAASKDRAKAAEVLTANKIKPTKEKIDQYLELLEAYNDVLSRIDESMFEYFEEEAIIDLNIGYLRGTREADFAVADDMADRMYGKAAGYTRRRRQVAALTWHHHPEMGRMILIKREDHGLAHWGGFAVWKMLTTEPKK